MSTLKIALFGFGRMGRELARLIVATPGMELAGAASRPENLDAGKPLAEVAGIPDLPGTLHASLLDLPPADVIIDFSNVHGTPLCIEQAAERSTPLVCGTTGLPKEALERLRSVSARIPVFYARNMSLGVNVLMQAVRMLADELPAGCHAEIVEKHHAGKLDTPSGTALAFAEKIAAARGKNSGSVIHTGRAAGHRYREADEITIHSLRLGGNPGEHQICFAFGAEEIVLTHRAYDRSVFARGALHAAEYIHGRQSGFYTMADLLKGNPR